MKKIVLITGASSGMGWETAMYLAKAGHIVFGTSRRAKKGEVLKVKENFFLIQMDVNKEGSVKKGINIILEQAEGIDILINNAGYTLAGSIEETEMGEVWAEFNTNFFGVHRVIKEIAPIMRKRQSGLIINISSLAGLIGLPFQGFYSASKYALEGYSEALRIELEPFGVRVVLVEPGDFNTNFTEHRQYTKKALMGDYKDYCRKAVQAAIRSEKKGDNPFRVAQRINFIIEEENPKLRWRIGPNASIIPLKAVLPEATTQYLVKKSFNL